MKTVKTSLLVIASVLFFLGCGGTETSNVVPNINRSQPSPVPAASATKVDDLAAGRELYETNCVICHKADGTGGKVTVEGKTLDPDDLTSEKIKNFNDEKITRYIVNGVVDEGMPAFKDKLTEAEIREVVNYLRKEIQKISPSAKSSPTT